MTYFLPLDTDGTGIIYKKQKVEDIMNNSL